MNKSRVTLHDLSSYNAFVWTLQETRAMFINNLNNIKKCWKYRERKKTNYN